MPIDRTELVTILASMCPQCRVDLGFNQLGRPVAEALPCQTCADLPTHFARAPKLGRNAAKLGSIPAESPVDRGRAAYHRERLAAEERKRVEEEAQRRVAPINVK
jgi:hypothetical protein